MTIIIDNSAQISALRASLEAAQQALRDAEGGKELVLGKQNDLQGERAELEKAERTARRAIQPAKEERDAKAEEFRKAEAALRLAEETLALKQKDIEDAKQAVSKKCEEQRLLAIEVVTADEAISVAQREVVRINQELRDIETAGQRLIREKRDQAATARSEAWQLEQAADFSERTAADARKAVVTFPSLKSTLIGEAEKNEGIVATNRARATELKAQADALDAEAKALDEAEKAKLGKTSPSAPKSPLFMSSGPVSTAGINKELGAGQRVPLGKGGKPTTSASRG